MSQYAVRENNVLLTPQSGASMSGDLKHPSEAIPKGTLYGLGLTFVLYTMVIIAMAASISLVLSYFLESTQRRCSRSLWVS